MILGTVLTAWGTYVAAETLIVRETVQNLPSGWKFEQPAKVEELITLTIALKQPRINDLKAKQAIDPETVDQVYSWLGSNGITDVVTNGPMITVTSTASNFNKILKTSIGYYSFQGSSSVLRAPSYSFPQRLDGSIEFIYPLSNFMRPPRSKLRSRPAVKSSVLSTNVDDQPCLAGVTPACLKSLYNVTYADTSVPTKSPARYGIAGFLEQYIKYDDVFKFLDTYAPELTPLGYNFSVAMLNNGTNPQPNEPRSRAGIEASLDVEYAMAMAYPANVIYYSTGGRGEKVDRNGDLMPTNRSDNEPYLEFLRHLLDLSDEEIPHVVSISYADDEQSVPAPYANRVCDLFALAAARGVTFLSGSGDGGAVEGAEFSTGGFSNYFARPEWQNDAVDAYISALGDSHKGLYNESGRAFPDISATGTNYAIQVGGYQTDVYGTSASTPVVAALVAVINDSRLKSGKNSTGWLNPVLYSQPVREALQDVTTGISQSCAFGEDTEPGWESKEGYDCVTGLGSIGDFGKLLEVLG